jgi:hypothetical protein
MSVLLVCGSVRSIAIRVPSGERTPRGSDPVRRWSTTVCRNDRPRRGGASRGTSSSTPPCLPLTSRTPGWQSRYRGCNPRWGRGPRSGAVWPGRTPERPACVPARRPGARECTALNPCKSCIDRPTGCPTALPLSRERRRRFRFSAPHLLHRSRAAATRQPAGIRIQIVRACRCRRADASLQHPPPFAQRGRGIAAPVRATRTTARHLRGAMSANPPHILAPARPARRPCRLDEQSLELERERARRHGLRPGDTRIADGHQLEDGRDGGGRRDFLAGRGVHAGETLYVLTYAGWHPVRYESNMPGNEPFLYLPLPGVRQDIVLYVPRQACFAWPEELRLSPR